MQSSFKRNTRNKEDSSKTFFGQPELDAILSNNIKKGTLILIEEDHPTTLHLQLERYFIGKLSNSSAYHMKQNSFIYDTFNKKWPTIIPQLLNQARLKKNEENQKKPEEQKSQIAWRYDTQKIQLKELQNLVSQDIPKLDLSKSQENTEDFVHCEQINDFNSLQEIYENLCEKYQNNLKSENDTEMRKILITNLFSQFSKIKFEKRDLIKFIYSLRTLIRSCHALLVLTIPPTISDEIKNILFLNFDIIMKIDFLFQHEELEQFQGILHFMKIANLNNFLNFRLDTLSWGIKASSKRKVEIDRLYLTPESGEQKPSKTETVDF